MVCDAWQVISGNSVILTFGPFRSLFFSNHEMDERSSPYRIDYVFGIFQLSCTCLNKDHKTSEQVISFFTYIVFSADGCA